MRVDWTQSENTLTLSCTSPGETTVFVSPHFLRITCIKTKRFAQIDLTGEVKQHVLRKRHVGSLFQVVLEKVKPGHWGRLDIVAPGDHVKARRAASIKLGQEWLAKAKEAQETGKTEMHAKTARNALSCHENRMAAQEKIKREQRSQAINNIASSVVTKSPSKENTCDYPVRPVHGLITVNFTPSSRGPSRTQTVD